MKNDLRSVFRVGLTLAVVILLEEADGLFLPPPQAVAVGAGVVGAFALGSLANEAAHHHHHHHHHHSSHHHGHHHHHHHHRRRRSLDAGSAGGVNAVEDVVVVVDVGDVVALEDPEGCIKKFLCYLNAADKSDLASEVEQTILRSFDGNQLPETKDWKPEQLALSTSAWLGHQLREPACEVMYPMCPHSRKELTAAVSLGFESNGSD